MDKVTNPFYHYQDLWKSENLKKWEQNQTEEYKNYRRLWQECPKTRKAPAFPISINIEITDVCNAKELCVMCPKHFLKPKNAFMPLETVKKILDEARANGAYAVNLNGAGESIAHPHILEIVKHAKDAGFLDIMFHTNGTLLSEAKSRGLIEAGITRLIVSVDAHIPEIYKAIRPSFDLEKVEKNVRKFIEIRDSMGRTEPIVRITMVVMKQNAATIDKTIDHWSFADYISINDCMYFDEFKVFDFNKDEIRQQAKDKKLSYVCAPLYQQLSVNIDLKVIACSTIYAKNYRLLGDYSKQSLKEIWEGPVLKELREAHEKGEYYNVLPCSKCDLPEIELLKKMRNTDGKVLTSR